jgi:CBS domain-containing protein/anti-sigma regulatory factor (Ser/Thr protein kinase)
MNDIIPSKIQEMSYECKVEDAMTTDPVTVGPDDTMMAVREIFKTKLISGLPVIGDDGLMGIVSVENFIKAIIGGNVSAKVVDCMTKDVHCIYADEPLIHAIRKFDNLRFGRFPVKDRETQKIVGIITKGDIIKCLLQRFESEYNRETSQKKSECIFSEIDSDRTTIILRHAIKGKEFKRAGQKSSCLKSSLLRLGIPNQFVRRVSVAAFEAEMNIIVFTDGGEITAYVENNNIKVNAIDNGPGIPDIEKAMQQGYSTAPDWVRDMGFGAGMGLPNIKSCTDVLTIDSKIGEGTKLEFIVNLKW